MTLSGTIMPPPIPCATRNAMRLPNDHAAPHSADPATKTANANSHDARVPNRSASRPVTATTIAIDSRYAVFTHCTVATEAWKALDRSASATVTIVMSSIAVTVPVTTTALNLRTSASSLVPTNRTVRCSAVPQLHCTV